MTHDGYTKQHLHPTPINNRINNSNNSFTLAHFLLTGCLSSFVELDFFLIKATLPPDSFIQCKYSQSWQGEGSEIALGVINHRQKLGARVKQLPLGRLLMLDKFKRSRNGWNFPLVNSLRWIDTCCVPSPCGSTRERDRTWRSFACKNRHVLPVRHRWSFV